jgi:hypothetical protein
MRPIKRAQWFGCWLALHVWKWLPLGSLYETGFPGVYGRFNYWLLGLAGAYAYSEDFEDFCKHVSFR